MKRKYRVVNYGAFKYAIEYKDGLFKHWYYYTEFKSIMYGYQIKQFNTYEEAENFINKNTK